MSMPTAGWIALAAAIWTAASLAILAFSVCCALLRRTIIARRAKSNVIAPVSVIIPVKLLDAGFEVAQLSALRGLPRGSEIIVTSREARSPALMAAKEAFAEARAPVRFLHSTATFAASPKIDNLAEAFDAAQNEILFMKDSNVELPHGVVSALESLDDDVGLVCAIPSASDARNFAAAVEAQVMNQSHGRLLLMADALGLGFGVGKIMVMRKSALARIGGLAAVAHSVGEDSALSVAFAKAGLRTAFMAPLIKQRLGERRWRDVFDRQMRWTAVRARNAKLAFALEPLGLCVVTALTAAIGAPVVGLPALAATILVLVIWFVLETALALSEGWDVTVAAPAVTIARDSLMLVVWMKAWFTRRVVWAGHRMPVSRSQGTPRSAETSLERHEQGSSM